MPRAAARDFDSAVSHFGAEAKRKLTNPAATGEPEDQLRAPLETLLADLAALTGLQAGQFVAVGESSISDLKTRPDYAISIRNALVGFVEVKAPGKGAEPTRFRDPHDKDQWSKLKAIPNLVYTDGNEFGLYRSGERVGELVRLSGAIDEAGRDLRAPSALLAMIEDFVRWQPTPPRTVKQLAAVTARLCRLLRDEVTEQMGRGAPGLTALATDWRRLLFPDATDDRFADGYAQAVTFGLLVARARGIELSQGLPAAARTLGHTDSLIGTALKLLTESEGNKRIGSRSTRRSYWTCSTCWAGSRRPSPHRRPCSTGAAQARLLPARLCQRPRRSPPSRAAGRAGTTATRPICCSNGPDRTSPGLFAIQSQSPAW